MAENSTGSSGRPSSKSTSGRSGRPAKKTSSQGSSQSSSQASGQDAPKAAAPKRKSPVELARAGAEQLLELTGKAAEGVTGLQRSEQGWTVQVEVVEVRRIPDTTDILALYELDLDERGDLQGYHRLRRYARGTPGDD